MAGRSSSLSMVASHHLFAPTRSPAPHSTVREPTMELDEADVILGGSAAVPPSSSPVDPYVRAPSVSAPSKQRGAAARDTGGAPGSLASLPVNIPDWSKILGAEYGGSGSAGAGWWSSDERGDACLDCSEDTCSQQWVPPHDLLLCQERAAVSFVRESAGRTLKGRDLRHVRNAIWEKTVFQD